MSKLQPIIWQLLALYIIIIITLILRIHVEATGYTSPDSHFYLRATENYLNNKGFVIPSEYPFNDNSPESFMATWAIGYPSYISLISKLTGGSVFWSSKITNFIFLAFIFILLYRWYGVNSFFPALYFCAFSKLEIYSYTWSEGTFLFFLLWFLFLLENILENKNISLFKIILLIFSLISLVWIRYAGLIYFFYTTIIFIILLTQQKYQKVIILFVILLISSSLVLIYLWYNYYHTGGFFGEQPRIFPETESWIDYLTLFAKGFFNELFIIRYFYGKLDILFFGLLFIQLRLIYLIITTYPIVHYELLNTTKNKLLISCGLFYLIFIFILRKLSPFDAFDYRILAPFSTPIYIATLAHLQDIIHNKKLKTTIIIFFILSLLMNLPKKVILQWIVS